MKLEDIANVYIGVVLKEKKLYIKELKQINIKFLI